MPTLSLRGRTKSKTITSLYYTHTSSLLHTFSLVYTREREGVCVVEREGSVTKSKKSKKSKPHRKINALHVLDTCLCFFWILDRCLNDLEDSEKYSATNPPLSLSLHRSLCVSLSYIYTSVCVYLERDRQRDIWRGREAQRDTERWRDRSVCAQRYREREMKR